MVVTEIGDDIGEPEKAVDYNQLIPILFEAIKAQQAKIDDLQSQINKLGKK